MNRPRMLSMKLDVQGWQVTFRLNYECRKNPEVVVEVDKSLLQPLSANTPGSIRYFRFSFQPHWEYFIHQADEIVDFMWAHPHRGLREADTGDLADLRDTFAKLVAQTFNLPKTPDPWRHWESA